MKRSLAHKLAYWASVWMVIRSDPTVVKICMCVKHNKCL